MKQSRRVGAPGISRIFHGIWSPETRVLEFLDWSSSDQMASAGGRDPALEIGPLLDLNLVASFVANQDRSEFATTSFRPPAYSAAIRGCRASVTVTGLWVVALHGTVEDGVFIAECPALPGCVSEGKTRQEALANIQDAMRGYVASLKWHGEPVPPPITEEIVEITL